MLGPKTQSQTRPVVNLGPYVVEMSVNPRADASTQLIYGLL
jgi:hypothetical protein